MTHDHTGSALFRVVAAAVDADLIDRRERHAWALHVEHARMAIARQRVTDTRIVAEREQRVNASRAHDIVRKALA